MAPTEGRVARPERRCDCCRGTPLPPSTHTHAAQSVSCILTTRESNVLLSNDDEPIRRDDTSGVEYQHKCFHVPHEQVA